jgi:hypothetical protein
MKRSLIKASWSLVAAVLVAITLGLLPARSAFAYPGADDLGVVQSCQPGNSVQVSLHWTSYNLGSQWIDVSVNNNNFAPGTYLSNGPFSPTMNLIVVNGAQTGTIIYARINTQTAAGWYPSSTIAFQTLSDCSSTVIVPIPAPPPVIIPVPVPGPIPAPVPVPVPVPVPGQPAPGGPPMVTPY